MRNAIIAAVLAATSSSYAEPPKYTRKPTLRLDVKQSARSRPARPAPDQPRPAVSADDVLLIHEIVEPTRREQEALLERLVRDTPDGDPDKPDYMFRLAEHYAQQLRFWRIKAVQSSLGSAARR